MTLLAGLMTLAVVTVGCSSDGGEADAGTSGSGGSDLSGDIKIDGSSTVAPLMTVAAEDFMAENSGVNVTVGTSGTGGGFEKFCAGETDISNASRPIKDEEATACADAGIEYTEFLVANDALAVVVNKDNDWATCLTVEQLNKIWAPDSTVDNWNQVDPEFPDQKLTLFGAGTDSGTFDYFTAEINGEEGASRTDYNPSEDDNVTVTGVEGDKGAMGYFGFSYFEENEDKLNAVEIDGGGGCVAPSAESVQDGTYTPLGRPLFIYVNNEAVTRPEVKAFIEFYETNSDTIAEESLFIPMTEEQKAEVQSQLESIA
jgi:phosphate transport system substrate-binding protein